MRRSNYRSDTKNTESTMLCDAFAWIPDTTKNTKSTILCDILAWILADRSRLALRTSFMRGAICPEDIMDPDTGADGASLRGFVNADCPRTVDVLVFPPL